MRYIGYIIILILIVLGVSFAVLNATPVNVNYYADSRTLPLSLLLAICFGVGVLLGILVMFMRVMRLRFENRILSRKLRKAEQQLEAQELLSKGSYDE